MKESGLMEDPLTSKKYIFSDEIKMFPKINIGQMFTYILNNKAFETEYIGQYKIRKAYAYFKSGFVDKLFVQNLSERNILRTSVTPSQRLNDSKHQLWILFDKDDSVFSSFCTCTAGFSKCCNHVVAALYKVKFAVENFDMETCTDNTCTWNSSSKDVQPMKLKNMTFIQHNKNQNQQKQLMYQEKLNFDPRPIPMRDNDRTNFFLKIRNTVPKAVINTCVLPPPDQDVPPRFPNHSWKS